MLTNTKHSYGWVTIAVHWTMALAIFGMFGLGVWMVDLGYYDTWYHRAPELHKSVGMILLLLLIFRWLWRQFNVRPELVGQWWEQLAALSVHRLHYLLLLAVMVTGYLIPTAEGVAIDVFGWFSVPAAFTFDKQQTELIGALHRYLAWSAVGLAGLHAAAALKHHFVDRDNTLRRMIGMKSK